MRKNFNLCEQTESYVIKDKPNTINFCIIYTLYSLNSSLIKLILILSYGNYLNHTG